MSPTTSKSLDARFALTTLAALSSPAKTFQSGGISLRERASWMMNPRLIL